jgi:hypothetical protein
MITLKREECCIKIAPGIFELEASGAEIWKQSESKRIEPAEENLPVRSTVQY